MLSKLSNKSLKSSIIPFCLSTLNLKRNFTSFDYIRVSNDLENGQSVQDTETALSNEREEYESSHFNWDWVDWYRENYPDALGTITSIQNKYRSFEQFVSERGVQTAVKSIPFDEYRNKICDPTFVDELEIQYNVNRNCLNSIKNMSTLEQWQEDSVKQFETECKNNGDLLWKPMTQNDKDSILEALSDTELEEQRLKELQGEFFKDYEQLEAEFSMFGHESQKMHFAEYPQYAENLEDRQGAKTAYDDINLLEYHINFIKREKLRQFQNEERRKEFLETFDTSSKILNGLDMPHDQIAYPRH